MRVLALLLILANVCFWFWSHYIDVPEARPVAAPTTAAERPPRLLLANEQARQDQQAGITAELSCISVGPFIEEPQWRAVAKRLQDAGFTSTPRSSEGEVFAGYWINLSGFATRADAEQTLARLRAQGVGDAFVMTEEPNPNVISLGLYADQSHAQKRLDDITQLGFTPQMQNRNRRGPVYWLDVALQEPGQLIDPGLLQPDNIGILRLETQRCPATAAATDTPQAH